MGNQGITLLRDSYGRIARDLRVSLTDRCNLRCIYCMPETGLPWIPQQEALTDNEVIRLLRIAVENLGIRHIRFTGGEPLLRRSLEKIIAATSELTTDEGRKPGLALTTNGLGLDHRAAALHSAGLDRVNISLDSINTQHYAKLVRRDRLPGVLAGIDAAHKVGLRPIKINTVVLPGINDQDVLPLALYALDHNLELRFIEQMPLGPPSAWNRHTMITAQDILSLLKTRFDLRPISSPNQTAPANLWHATDREEKRQGIIGIIASVTQPFCADCDRARLTTDGALRNCLFSQHEISLRDLMRSGASDNDLIEAWAHHMSTKAAGHGIDDPTFIQPQRPMSAIGG